MSHLLNNCYRFMFTRENLKKFPDIKEKEQPIITKKDKVIKKPPFLFIPRYHDTLFWCFYIIIKGWEAFFLVGRQHFFIEKNYKIKCIEKIRISKDILKKYRWKKNALENELINQKNISVNTFICLCGIYGINVTIITEHYYYSYISNDIDTMWYIKKNNSQFGIYTGEIPSLLQTLAMTWKIDNLKKPLKGFSAYKVAEIKSICQKLSINTCSKTGRYNKRELYKLIQSKIE